MSSRDPVIAVSDREGTTVGQAGSRRSVMVTGILVAAAVAHGGEGSTISPVISVNIHSEHARRRP